MANQYGNMRNKANIGDLVTIDGYGDKIFQVEGYTHYFEYGIEGEIEEIVYDVTEVISNETAIGYQDEIKVVEKAEKASEYIDKHREAIKNNDRYSALKNEHHFLYDLLIDINAYSGIGKSDNKVKRNYDGEIDDLLMELSDYKTLIEMFGDNDGRYTRKIADIKHELIKIAGRDRNE